MDDMLDYPEVGRAGYAVLWREADGVVCSGQLEFRPEALVLAGSCRDGDTHEHEIAYRDVTRTKVGRAVRERIDGRPTLIIETASATLHVTSTVGLGIIHEMAERLEDLTTGSAPA
jgi:hypothetical protein